MTTTPTQGSLVTFMGLTFETNDAVLIPREETELLGRTALDVLKEVTSQPPRVIDMCCGSGNLACSLAHARPDLRVWASDLTDPCVELARRNVARHGLGHRVEIHQGDLFESLGGIAELERAVDVVVCNPPYISTSRLANESAHLLDGQPREAFDGGPYGFSIHKRVIQDAPRFLRPNAWLIMEIGLGQERQVEQLFTRVKLYEERRFFNDGNGAPRVVAARLASTND